MTSMDEPAHRDAAPAPLPRSERADEEQIAAVWSERWGGEPIVTPGHLYTAGQVEGIVLNSADGALLGLVCWAIHGDRAELVSIDALTTGHGHGSRLLQLAEGRLRDRGLAAIQLVTSNDNTRALRFYQRRGYRLVRVHLDAMAEARRHKPGIPSEGIGGVPLRDLWELEKRL